jgi:hypothetical protein
MREYQIESESANRRTEGGSLLQEKAEERRSPKFDLLPQQVTAVLNRDSIAASHAFAGSRLQQLEANSLLRLQRTRGNRYVQRVLAIARSGGGEVASEVETTIDRARGGGQALDHGVRRQMETAFGADFGAVRVHTGTEAHQLNHAVSAIAFTTGPDIFFQDGAYNPSSSEGKELLAHELMHVVQQGGVPGNAQRVQVKRMCPACEEEKKDEGLQYKLTVNQPDDQYEQEADQMAGAVVRTLDSANATGAGVEGSPVLEPLQRREAGGNRPSGPDNISEESPAPAGGPTQAPEEAPSARAAAGGEAATGEVEPEEVSAA